MPGMMKPVNKKNNPGLAKLPQDVRNKMGYMQKGGNVTKKYAKGGMGSKDEFVFDEDMLAEQAKKPTYAEMTKLDERDKREMAIQERVREKAKKETFKEAFAKARAANKKVFEWPIGSGKKYTTQTKEEATAAKKKSSAKKADRIQTDPGLLPSQAKKQARDVDARKTGSQRLAEKADRAGNIYARAKGGMMKYNKGGLANCGASMKPNGGSRNK